MILPLKMVIFHDFPIKHGSYVHHRYGSFPMAHHHHQAVLVLLSDCTPRDPAALVLLNGPCIGHTAEGAMDYPLVMTNIAIENGDL